MNTTVKKQNRILLISLVVLLAAAAVLIAVTGGANRKAKETVPAETEQSAEGKEKEKSPVQKKEDKSKTETDMKETAPESVKAPVTSDEIPFETEPSTPKTEDSAEIPSAEEVSAMLDPNEPLPTFSLPVDDLVLKGYSADVPVFSYTMNDYRTHEGIDIAASAGTPVFAAADGTVCEVAHDPMMGVTIGIQHTGGAVTRYKGLSEDSVNLVETGTDVKRGQVIGAAGDTALIESAEEGHVHFELTVDGESRDPADYMKLTYLADLHEG